MKWKLIVIFLFFFASIIRARKVEEDEDNEFLPEEGDDEFVGQVLEEDNDESAGDTPGSSDKDFDELKADDKVQPIVEIPVEVPKVWYKKYVFEIGFSFVVIVFIIQSYRGQSYNKTLVAAWLNSNLKFFEDQFASIGITHPQEGETQPNAEPNKGALLEQHSYNMFKFFATGRVNCEYCLVTFELKRRQDMFTMVLFNILWPEKDKVIYDIPLSVADPFPCVFAIVRRNEMKAILEDNKLLVISLFDYRKIIPHRDTWKDYQSSIRC
jgi:hypothetical protein